MQSVGPDQPEEQDPRRRDQAEPAEVEPREPAGVPEHEGQQPQQGNERAQDPEFNEEALDRQFDDDRLEAAPSAHNVSPAIMTPNDGAMAISRRRQANHVRVPESAAAKPMGIAAGTFWKAMILAPTRPPPAGTLG